MIIDEAIVDLQARIDGEFSIKGVDDCKDMKLGIEALKRIKLGRDTPSGLSFTPLPGETEE